jgi:hypothetical protein
MSHKTFAWLLLVDHLNTRDLLHRRHWNTTEDKHCVLCPLRAHEDRIHLFFQCNFSSRVWNYLQIDWIQNDDLQVVISATRNSFGKPFFMEVLVLACRGIWLIRNDKIFNQARPTFTKWKHKFIHDISWLQYRIKEKHKPQLLAWIEALP